MPGALGPAPTIRAAGAVRQVLGDRKTAVVHEADIAAVAAVALAQDGHAGRTYAITGPEVLTPRRMTDIIAAGLGRDLRFSALAETEARDQWRSEGFRPEVVEFFAWAHGSTRPKATRSQRPSPGARRSGRPARDRRQHGYQPGLTGLLLLAAALLAQRFGQPLRLDFRCRVGHGIQLRAPDLPARAR